jgi:hypothetical protein
MRTRLDTLTTGVPRLSLPAFVEFEEKRIDALAKRGQARFDDEPDHVVRDARVPMCELVPERDDPARFVDLVSQCRVIPQGLAQRLADDLELTLDGGSNEDGSLVVIERGASR